MRPTGFSVPRGTAKAVEALAEQELSLPEIDLIEEFPLTAASKADEPIEDVIARLEEVFAESDAAQVALDAVSNAVNLPEDAGAPEQAGPPNDEGAPADAGPPEETGKPEHAGAPEDAGSPEETGVPDDLVVAPPELPELSLPVASGADIDIPAADLPDLFDFV